MLRPRRWRSVRRRRAAARRRLLLFCAASTSAQRTCGEPCWEMWPRRALPSEERTVGVRPAQAQRCRAVGKRSTRRRPRRSRASPCRARRRAIWQSTSTRGRSVRARRSPGWWRLDLAVEVTDQPSSPARRRSAADLSASATRRWSRRSTTAPTRRRFRRLSPSRTDIRAPFPRASPSATCAPMRRARRRWSARHEGAVFG